MIRPETISILDLTADEARTLLLSSQSYCSLDLPNYVDFSAVLSCAEGIVQGKFGNPYRRRSPKPNDLDGVNHRILDNKDGLYAWRPFQLVHPVLYVELVDQITEPSNWQEILCRFAAFGSDSRIQCLSLPVIDATKPPKEAAILNWWARVEQESVRLSLDYTHLAISDITDCYGALYTHSIPWALHTKPVAKHNRKRSLIGNRIDELIRDMQNGQTNGIPQGNVLSDLIAEMVLGYADEELARVIDPALDFRLIRYRDDYRIFTNSAEDAHTVLYALTNILESLNFKLNGAKTHMTSDVLGSSIKPDKLHWWGVVNSRGDLFKTLMLLREMGKRFPNSGTLSVALSKFRKRLEKLPQATHRNNVLIPVVADLMYQHPRLYAHASAVLSKLLELEDDSTALTEIQRVRARFERVPNVGLLEIWLQRFSQKYDPTIEYEEKLCQLISGKSDVELWNSDWLDLKAKAAFGAAPLIDQVKLQNVGKVISLEETELFLQKYDEDIDINE